MTTIAVGEHIVIDSQQRQVTAFGEKVELPERSYRLLLTLVEHAPNIVSHDELIKTVWKETVVSDESLKQRISRLRKQLAKIDPNATEYFIAERGLGYRCSAPIRIITKNPLANSNQTESFTNQTNHDSNQTKSFTNQTKRDSNQTKSFTKQTKHDSNQTKSFTNQTNGKKSVIYLWSFALIAIVFVLVMFNQNDSSLAQQTPVDDNQLLANSSSLAATLTPDDFEKQARQYYYRFNSAANDTSIGLYRQAINIDPNYAQGYFGLANSYAQGFYQYGKPYQWLSQSIQYSKQAIEIAPEQAWGYKSLGLGLYLDGQYNQAIENYQKSSEYADWWASPVNNAALAQMETGQLIAAYQNAIKAVALDPKDPIPYLFLGLIYRDLAMSGHATKAISRAINFMPDYNLAISYQAEFLLVNGQYQNAIDTANTALTTNFDNQLAYWVIAHAWLAQANSKNAIEALQEAANLGGRYTPIVLSYLAILNHQPLDSHQQLLQAKIEQGNQWFEYPLALAAIKAVNNQPEQSLQYIQQAIDAGLNHPSRFEFLPFFKNLTKDTQTNTALLTLIKQLEEKIAEQRQKVIHIEQSRDF